MRPNYVASSFLQLLSQLGGVRHGSYPQVRMSVMVNGPGAAWFLSKPAAGISKPRWVRSVSLTLPDRGCG
jgi:hypothetical protein